ncbi:IS110 family transposase [Erysipelothrix sp. HDW6A]|uniref:IS110 family transposase n=1 Tax=Erysipelothrix sp. HDW6A TaxID=2714928 RepID=UPI00140CE022|nr:IS110 family transposase [Erysipelothrix sp. HDW6A]QIK57040.1 IS110 family transposase [Erysipelothrix sp. HDW6A]
MLRKHKHVVAIVNQHGEVHLKPTQFENSKFKFNRLYELIKPFILDRHHVGLEATGHYGDNLIRFLLDKHCDVRVMNPLTTDAFRKQRIRKTKTDSIDCFIICDVLQSGHTTKMTKKKFVTREGKQITRFRQELMDSLTMVKNQLQACLDLVFPEYNTVFKTKYSKAYIAVLKEFPSAQAIAPVHLTKLRDLILKVSSKRINPELPNHLKEIAKNSIGEPNQVIELKIQMFIESIEMKMKQIEKLNHKIETLSKELNSPIFTIPGIGFVTGFTILCEIQDISLFDAPAKLIAYAGCDPAVYQSGDYNAPTTAISKRGSRYLRLALYQAALPAATYNETFGDYYRMKRSQGKKHHCSQGHLVRKLLRVIFKLLKNNTEFNPTLCI